MIPHDATFEQWHSAHTGGPPVCADCQGDSRTECGAFTRLIAGDDVPQEVLARLPSPPTAPTAGDRFLWLVRHLVTCRFGSLEYVACSEMSFLPWARTAEVCVSVRTSFVVPTLWVERFTRSLERVCRGRPWTKLRPLGRFYKVQTTLSVNLEKVTPAGPVDEPSTLFSVAASPPPMEEH